MYCRFKECCDQKWTAANKTGLQKYLNESVFGQHLALDVIPKSIKGHLNDKEPKKPLVLSLHGGTGSGKNFISSIIVEHLYPKGYDSSYVTRILSAHEFPSKDPAHLENYKAKLKKMIQQGILKCPNALYVIDEIDKMPTGLSNALKAYLDFNDKVDGFDYRKSIFLLLSNTGTDEINKGTLLHWKSGKKRGGISLKAMNKLLKTVSYHSDAGLEKSRLIDHHLVDFNIPFLPMERRHVELCASVVMKKRGIRISDQRLEDIADQLEYFPFKEKLYSVFGCKNVERLVQINF